MTPEQQAVVDRIMVLAYDYRLGKLDGHPYGGPSYNALRTAIEELAQQAAASQPLVPPSMAMAVMKEWCLASQEAPAGWKIVPVEPTPEMVKAYLQANDAYWHRVDDEGPPPVGIWRNGTPQAATAESYRAMLAASSAVQEAPAAEHAADGWEAPDFRKAWQGGLTNEELEQWWRLKLPHVEATNRDICVFALGVEVGAGMGEAPKPSTALAASREGSLPEGRACEAPSGEAVEPGGEATRPEASAEQAAQQADARDAARYRWLRRDVPYDECAAVFDLHSGAELDAAIDAAMTASKKEG